MTFTWTRNGERITSTCPRCYATEKSRFPGRYPPLAAIPHGACVLEGPKSGRGGA